MSTFRVIVEGRPLFLFDAQTNRTDRLGFFTTRWVRAGSREEACIAACKLVMQELSITGNRNPPDQPLTLAVSEVVELSWTEGLRHWRSGRGFSLFSDDAA